MKAKQLQICLLCALISGATISAPSNAQDETAQTAPSTAQNSQWKSLADQIIQLEGDQSFERRDLSQAQQATYDRIIDLYTELNNLPAEQTVQAHRYMMAKSSNLELRYGEATNLLAEEPTTENVNFVLPYFGKFTNEQKTNFLHGVVLNATLLRPDVPEFHAFTELVLEQAAQDAKLSEDVVSQAAVTAANRTTAQEKQWMHQALTRYPESSGLWNTLTQLNALTPAEVQKARQLFAVKQQQSGWRLTLAAALSPYDPKMRELVRQTVATQISTYANADALPQPLMILRMWETKQALPYLLRMLNSNNNEMKLASVPLLALRAPQELLRVAQLPNAKKKVPNLGEGLALAALVYPQFRPQASQIMIKLQGLTIYPQDDPQEVADETFNSNVEMLQSGGMEVFSLNLIP